MGIEPMISSMQGAPHCPLRKWHGWMLCWTPSSPSQGLLEYKLCSNQFWFFRSLLLFSYQRGLLFQWHGYHLSLQKWVAPVAWLLSLSSVACFASCRILARLSQVARCFQRLCVSSSSSLYLPITSQRDLVWFFWCCESFECYSISVLRSMQCPGTAV